MQRSTRSPLSVAWASLSRARACVQASVRQLQELQGTLDRRLEEAQALLSQQLLANAAKEQELYIKVSPAVFGAGKGRDRLVELAHGRQDGERHKAALLRTGYKRAASRNATQARAPHEWRVALRARACVRARAQFSMVLNNKKARMRELQDEVTARGLRIQQLEDQLVRRVEPIFASGSSSFCSQLMLQRLLVRIAHHLTCPSLPALVRAA